MNKKIIIGLVVLGLAVTGMIFNANAGSPVPKGAEKEMKAGTIELEATGCGIVKADELKTTLMIKCEKCGFESKEIEIDTPTADKPYSMEWTCPKCGYKQKIEIQVKKK